MIKVVGPSRCLYCDAEFDGVDHMDESLRHFLEQHMTAYRILAMTDGEK